MMLTRFYAALLRLYPHQFRADFSEEMEDVFWQATRKNNKAVICFLRELRDLPGNLIRQHWSAIHKEKNLMSALPKQIEQSQPGTWSAAILAGLPHLLMALLIGIGKLFDQNLQINQTISAVLGILLGLAVTAILVFAWRRGWPLWSASWYLYGSWVILMALSLGIRELNLEESWRYSNALFLGWIAVCIIGYFVILTKSKLHGLLSVAFLFPLLGVIFLEFVPNPIEGGLAIALGLLAALTAATIVRLGNFRLGLWFVLGVNIVAGLSLAFVSEYQMRDLPDGLPAHIPRFSNFLEFLLLYSIFGLGIVTLPFILRGLWNFGKRRFTL